MAATLDLAYHDGELHPDDVIPVHRVDRNAFQLWIAVTCTGSGAAGMAGLLQDDVVRSTLPTAATLWYLGLLASGLVLLAAALMPRPRRVTKPPMFLAVEQAGLIMLGCGLAGYGVAVLLVDRTHSGGYVLLSLVAACGWRLRQIRRQIRTMRELLAAAVRLLEGETGP